jgi:hypothetical protein
MIAPMIMKLKIDDRFSRSENWKNVGVPPSPKKGQVDDNKCVARKVFKRFNLEDCKVRLQK